MCNDVYAPTKRYVLDSTNSQKEPEMPMHDLPPSQNLMERQNSCTITYKNSMYSNVLRIMYTVNTTV